MENKNNLISSYLKTELEKKGVTPKQMQDDLNVSQQYISSILNGKKSIGKRMANKLSSLYNLDELFIVTGIVSANAIEPQITLKEVKQKYYSNSLEVKVVTTKARAGYSDAYYSDEYLNDLPTVLIEADREYKGKYLAFEVDGDSMEPEYNKGDIVICREVQRSLWQYKLHFKEYDFVIAHGTKGIMLKEITDHDTETGEITCHSLNNEDGKHKDFKINLREVAFLYNVVEHRISGKSKRRNR